MKPLAICLAALATITALPVHAGTSGVLNGFARDERGAPIAAVQIKAVSASRYATARTDAHGFFSFIDLPPDFYTIAVEKLGFIAGSYARTRVNSDQTTFFTVELVRGGCHSGPGQAVDQRSEDFVSLDLRVPAVYPRPLQFPIIAVPGPDTRTVCCCL
jgi:hypothetical protein